MFASASSSAYRILHSMLLWTHNSMILTMFTHWYISTVPGTQLASPMLEPRSSRRTIKAGAQEVLLLSEILAVTKMVQGHHCVELLCTVQLIRWKGWKCATSAEARHDMSSLKSMSLKLRVFPVNSCELMSIPGHLRWTMGKTCPFFDKNRSPGLMTCVPEISPARTSCNLPTDSAPSVAPLRLSFISSKLKHDDR